MLTTCAHLDHNGCTKSMIVDFDRFSGTLTRISSHIQEWFERAQELSFPRVGIEAAKQVIGAKEILASEFNATSEIIHRLFEERGGYGKSHQVLVAPSEDEFDWMMGNITGRYNNFTINGGSTVHVFQFGTKSDSARVEKARMWTDKHRETIREVISDHASYDPFDILSAISLNPSTAPALELHRAAILVGRQSIFKKDAEIAVGLHPAASDAANVVEYCGTGIYKRNWKLYLFA
ncbi:hypothetical protein PMAYCL1PPCAC_08036 [Pristionchus mayeri]|uniref:Uncharacterized protein n=1 Tax=Pristionchus mayeri TaxID=1317129 RepID=A0AAN4ZEW7_9BILA|nr:hypothetical protein PMAYCL1PPCAC_08036 [Pristionchus mayeri]